MTDTAVAEQAPATPVATPKKTKAAGKKKTSSSGAKKASHPPTSKMVVTAISSLKERGGSSVQAIKKYIASTYKTDSEKLAPFIKKYIKSAVASGELLQTKGKGASGSFKLAKAAAGEGAPKKAPVKTLKAKKSTTEKKSKPAVVKKAAAKKKPAAPKAKKTTKTPTKPKAPKVKKATKPASTVKKSPAKPKTKKAAATKKKAPAKK